MHDVEISRRNLIAGCSAIAGGFAASGAVAQTAQTAPSQPKIGVPAIRRIMLGHFEITMLLDGGRIADVFPHFASNRTQEEVSTLLLENFLPATKNLSVFIPVLINTGSELVLFDTGVGAEARAEGLGQLESNLNAAGYSMDQITIVALTHMHGDHINGMMTGGKPSFPNARYLANRIEYDFWTDPARAGTPEEKNAGIVNAKVKPLAEKFTFFEAGEEILPGIKSEAAYGHTPGHTIYHIESEGEKLTLTGDTSSHYVASLLRPDWEPRLDFDKAMATETRNRVFGGLADERTPFIGYHMPFPGIGYVRKLDIGFQFIPLTYQFDVNA